MRSRRPVVIRREQAAEERLDAQHGEEVARNELAGSALEVPRRAREDGGLGSIERDHPAERLALIAQNPIRRIGEAVDVGCRGTLDDQFELLRILHRKHPQHHGVDQAEYRRVGADA